MVFKVGFRVEGGGLRVYGSGLKAPVFRVQGREGRAWGLPEHHADDVLANVVHVPLDGREEDAASLLRDHARVLQQLAGLLRLREGQGG